jgi:hypothetical protein
MTDIVMLDTDKLAKLFALASSDNDNEALGAMRKAKTMLSSARMDFNDVADRMVTPKATTSGFDYSAWAAQRQPPKPERYTDSCGNTWESKAAYDANMAATQVVRAGSREVCRRTRGHPNCR